MGYKTMKIQVSNLSGSALDWAVAKCEGWTVSVAEFRKSQLSSSKFAYSTVWAKGGPIIEREGIDLQCQNTGLWSADLGLESSVYGHTPLVAAMRCYVASKLGDMVDVPEELTL